ncbi:MAG TPA: FAD-dependent monooxygenase [Burkholderiales bacterium]|nr:FAD-dependent monooxygenase [Burkholderiales bacterium]
MSAEILIIGGGIGGVASALALARRGLSSRVLEKAPEFGEIGYGIQQGPNAYRMLDWLGVMKDLEPQAVFTKNLILIDALTDRELTRISCGETFRTHFRAPYTVVHRRDLHGALLEACRQRDEITLHTSKELVSFDDRAKSVVARFADGSEYEGRALIGADGLRSRVREIVIGDGPPRPAGHVTYRGVVPVAEVKDQSHFDDMVIWIGPKLHLVQYRLRGGTVMNNVATVSSRKFEDGERRDYGGPEELAEVFSRTTPQVQEMLGYVGKDKNWVLHDREPRAGWTRGNVALLGDAAHPTLQYLAQGACMAIEDSVVLSGLLEKALAKGSGDVAAALQAYEKERYLRTARVTITSRIFGDIIHADGGSRDLRNHLLAQRTPDTFWEIDWLYRGIEA